MRPFRFGFNMRAARSADEWRKAVRQLEDMGFAVLELGDHLADLTGHVTKPPVSDEADAWGDLSEAALRPSRRSWPQPRPPRSCDCARASSTTTFEADIVAILRDPATSFAEQVSIVRSEAGDRFDDVEINVSVRPGLGCGWMGADRSLSLGGSAEEMVSFLQRERDENDVSYVSLMDTFGPPDRWAPVVDALAGQ